VVALLGVGLAMIAFAPLVAQAAGAIWPHPAPVSAEITTTAGAPATTPVVAPRPVSAAELAALPPATTFGTVTGAPPDPDPTAPPTGDVVHPTVPVPVYAAPGGPAIAAAPVQQPFGSPPQDTNDTWLPVIDRQPGWARVLLPDRPNSSTGWLAVDDRVTTAHTPYVITVDRATFTLTLLRDGAQVGRWTVGVGKLAAQSGKPESITPVGRSFVLGDVLEAHPTYSPVILPLGLHSDTFESYGGGPGEIGVHSWPTSTVYGQNSSDGCIRVPPDALQILSTTVPLGTAVLIT
jgi:hypothetical protein